MEKSETISSNNRRIAQNTLMLYVRMFIMMGISLYTSRIVLQILGVEDFGIYNIVGGIVILFSFINGAMVTSTQRFLNFELGRGDISETQKVFSVSLNIHFCIAVAFIILAETIGLWFLNVHINIPIERVDAANWVYQFTIITSVLNIIKAPYNASIIAYEQMKFYAYISIIEACLKLGIVFLLSFFTDKLIAYATLITIVSAIVLLIYVFYSRQKFEICRNHSFVFDKKRFKALANFSSWSLLGSIANVGSNQGMNIVLNIFYGVVVNAAMGIANQINNTIYQFVTNFQIAFNPQITKLVATRNYEAFQSLVFDTSRYSFFLLFLIVVPFTLCCREVILLWLGTEPEFSVSFAQIMATSSLFDALSGPLWVSVYASGKIRKYQITISILLLMTIPLSYLAIHLGYNPIIAASSKLCISVIVYVYRLLYCCKYLRISFHKYTNIVLAKCFYVVIIVITFSLITIKLESILLQYESWYGFILKLSLPFLATIGTIYLLGITKNERNSIKNHLKKILINNIKNER